MKKTNSPSHRSLLSRLPLLSLSLEAGAAVSLVLLAAAGSLRAQTFTGSGNWSNSSNWLNGNVPGNDGQVSIYGPGSATGPYAAGPNTDDIASLSLAGVLQEGAVGPTTLAVGTALTFNSGDGGLIAYGGSTSLSQANGFNLLGGDGTAAANGGASLTFATTFSEVSISTNGNSQPIVLTANGAAGGTFVSGVATSYSPAVVTFGNNSFAGPATLIANPGQAIAGSSYLGLPGRIVFTGSQSSGGTAAVILNSYSLGANVSAGTLDISGVTSSGLTNNGTTVGSISGSGNIVLGSKNLAIGGLSASTSFSGLISGSGGSLTLFGGASGNGYVNPDIVSVLKLSNANTYSGGTTVNGGTLQAGANGSVFGSGTMTVNGGTLDLDDNSPSIGGLAGTGGTITNSGGSAATLTVTGGSGSYAGVLQNGSSSSTLGLAVTGGTTTLTGTNTYTGGTTIGSGATLQLGNGAQNAGTTAPNGGNLIAGAVTNNGTLAFNFAANSNTNLNSTLTTPVISGSGGVVMNGSGNLIINSSATYTGGTTVNAGSLSVATTALGSANGSLTVNGGTVYLDSALNVGALNGTGGAISSTAGGQDPNTQLIVGNGNASGSYAGSIQNGPNGPGLIKVGTGTQVLSGANTYTYSTQVEGGTLSIAPGGSLAASAFTIVSVASGATFNLNGTSAGTASVSGTMSGSGTNAGATTINSGGMLAPGNGASASRLTISAGLTLASGSTTAITLGGTASGAYSQVYAGSLSLGGTLSVTTANGFTLAPGETFTILDNTGTGSTTGTFVNTPLGQYTNAAGDTFLVDYLATTDGTALNDVTLTFEGVPEPSTWVLLLVGAGLLGVFIRRRGERRSVN